MFGKEFNTNVFIILQLDVRVRAHARAQLVYFFEGPQQADATEDNRPDPTSIGTATCVKGGFTFRPHAC